MVMVVRTITAMGTSEVCARHAMPDVRGSRGQQHLVLQGLGGYAALARVIQDYPNKNNLE
jgi:hypothetical protein